MHSTEERVNGNRTKNVVIIPARYGSTRFPGKPLVNIAGKPMIQWVYERINSMEEINSVYVATDDNRIYKAVHEFDGKVILTGECSCGTDRVYQACKNIDADIILNVQGDEPLIKPEMIMDLLKSFEDEKVQMATLKKKISDVDELNDPNVVKVITDKNNDAVYFSRYTIPFNRDNKSQTDYYKHIGIYGYRKEFLKKFVELPQGKLEKAESLEQLRAIENGYKIKVQETAYQSVGVDKPEDIERVLAELEKEQV